MGRMVSAGHPPPVPAPPPVCRRRTDRRYPGAVDGSDHRRRGHRDVPPRLAAARRGRPHPRRGRRTAHRGLRLAPPLAGGRRLPAVDRQRLDGLPGRRRRRDRPSGPAVRRAGLRRRPGGRDSGLAAGLGRRRRGPGVRRVGRSRPAGRLERHRRLPGQGHRQPGRPHRRGRDSWPRRAPSAPGAPTDPWTSRGCRSSSPRSASTSSPSMRTSWWRPEAAGTRSPGSSDGAILTGSSSVTRRPCAPTSPDASATNPATPPG